MPNQFDHCGFCGIGESFDDDITPSGWAFKCSICNHTSYKNPAPIAVAVVRLPGHRIVLIERNEDPGKGQLALPGGHIEYMEQWGEAALRELKEETMFDGNINFKLFNVITKMDYIICFGVSNVVEESGFKNFKPSDEVSKLVFVDKPVELAFPSHTQVLKEVFEKWK